MGGGRSGRGGRHAVYTFPYLIKQLKQFDPKVMKTTDKVGGGTLRRARLTRAKAKRDTEEKQL